MRSGRPPEDGAHVIPTARGNLPLTDVAAAAADAMSAAIERRQAQQRMMRAREDAAKRRNDWIADQLRRDFGEGGVRVESVGETFGIWSVRLLQWLPHGVAAIVTHRFKPPRVAWDEDHDETTLRAGASGRFAQLAERQRAFVAEWGEPRTSTPEEIDLSTLRIERPLAAAMALAFGDAAGAMLRRAIAENVTRPWQGEQDARRSMEAAGIAEMEISVARGIVKGVFAVKTGEIELRWSKGGLNIVGVEMAETIMTALASGRRPLSTVLSHPLFDGDMTVTAVHPMRRKGRAGMALTIRDMEGPVPTDW